MPALYWAPGAFQHWARCFKNIIWFLQRNLKLRGAAQGYTCGPQAGIKPGSSLLLSPLPQMCVKDSGRIHTGGSGSLQTVSHREQRQLDLPWGISGRLLPTSEDSCWIPEDHRKPCFLGSSCVILNQSHTCLLWERHHEPVCLFPVAA